MNTEKTLPNGIIIDTPRTLGEVVRNKRKEDNLTQVELAELTGVGLRFLSELENGKPTIQLNKVLLVLSGLGLKIEIGQ